MKKLFFIFGIILSIVLTGCAHQNDNSSDTSQKQDNPKKKSVVVQWKANTSRAAETNTNPEKIKVHFYKVPIENNRYNYKNLVEIDSFEISEGDSLDKDYRDQVPEGYILGFSAENYVMTSKANDGYIRNGEEQETFFELRFETLENDIVLPSTLLGKKIDDEELYNIPETNWSYFRKLHEGEWNEEIHYRTNNYELHYFDYQAIVEVLSNTGYLAYWFSRSTASSEEKALAKQFIKDRFGVTVPGAEE